MQVTQRQARLTMKHKRCGRQRSPGQSPHRRYHHTSALAPVRLGLQPCSTSSSTSPPSTTTPTLPPLVCTSYITEQSVTLSLYGMILLPPDCSRFLSPAPTVGRVRLGRSLPLEQFMTLMLRSYCLALAFCSACLFVTVYSLLCSLFCGNCSCCFFESFVCC